MSTLARRTHPSSSPTVQSPFLFWEGKTSNNSSASPWVQSLCWLCNIFFCFLLKICESASSLSCPFQLTDRKCIFVHILAFPSWVLHHLILDFFFPHCSYYFLFQAFSDVLALSYFHGFIPHSQTVLDNALGLVLHWETHPGPAGSIPSPSVSIKEKHLRCSSRAVLEKIPLSSRQTTRTGVRTSKM